MTRPMRGNRPDKTGLSFPKTKISPSRKRKKEGLDLPFSGDPAGARTQDPNIKSVVLYQLSYGISVCQNENRFRFGGANVRIYF